MGSRHLYSRVHQVNELWGERVELAHLAATSYGKPFQVSKACLWLRWAFQHEPAHIVQVRTDPALTRFGRRWSCVLNGQGVEEVPATIGEVARVCEAVF